MDLRQNTPEPFGGQGLRQCPSPNGARRGEPLESVTQSAGAAPILEDDVSGAALMKISRRKFRELCDEGVLPRPIQLGPRLVRWSRAELEAAVAAMPRQEHPSEPAQLRRARIEGMKRGGQ